MKHDTTSDTTSGQWRLTAITATDDGAYDATVSTPTGESKSYTFTAETVDVAGTPLPLVRCVAFDNDTLYDRQAAKAVFDAVSSFHHAHQHTINLKAAQPDNTTNAPPPPNT